MMNTLEALPLSQQAEAVALAVERIKSRQRRDPWIGQHGTAREAQKPPPGDWAIWLIMAGRGFGKTRSGAEFVRMKIMYGGWKHVALVAPTSADARGTMIEGESGLLEVCKRAGFGATFNPSKRQITFQNGAKATYYTAEKPRQLRGPNHDGAWADELPEWKYPETFDMLRMTTRNATTPMPQIVITMTPKPTKLVRKLVRDAQDPDKPGVVMTTGNSFENRANLSEGWFSEHLAPYEGTRLGRQELYAELLEDYEGALWSLGMIDASRVGLDKFGRPVMPSLEYITVSVDPATTDGKRSDGKKSERKPDQTGIAVTGRGTDKDFYMLHAEGVTLSPERWIAKTCLLYEEFEANEIVYEGNQGGDMPRDMIYSWWELNRPNSVKPKVRRLHSRGQKNIRAEPIAMLYEQRRVHHVGTFREAEDQMAAFPVDETAGDDIVDAVVQGVTACHKRQLGRVR